MANHFTRQLKRTCALTLALLIALSAFACAMPTALADEAEGVTVVIHYHREDGNYEGWDVWYWEVGGEGGGAVFEPEDGGVVTTIHIHPGIISMGYIVRQGGDSWAGKDVDADQFLTFPEVASGTIHLYVESGVPNIAYEYGDDAVIVQRPSKTSYDDIANEISVTLTAPVDGDPAEAFTIVDEDGNIAPIAEVVTVDDWNYTLKMSEALDLFKTYTITYLDGTYPVTLPNVYSTAGFEEEFTYTGDDLGYTWTAEKTSFRVWAPTADSVSVNLYESGTEGTDDLIETIPMTADVNGTWVAEKEGDLNGTYYTYTAVVNGETHETVDPYARATGVNGKRSMVLDLDSTDPEGWDTDKNPNADLGYNDAVIYELHVRDLSVDESSGIQNKGKFLGLIETGTVSPEGIPTGLDHIKDLGVTHIHLLPSYDYGSVDETRLDEPQFNWGYDPVNYNVPEGSYSTDPYNGAVRVSEMKQMVKGLHDNGISVIMDVVYNHVQDAAAFSVNQLVPGYFSRINDDGSYSNGSGCGNDTASERSMVHKYIVDSVIYWCDEYHIDGFRFDLVGLLDKETINELVDRIHAVRPDVIFYGEGWTMSTDITKASVVTVTQAHSFHTPNFAFFSDNIRDDLKGSVFDKNPGFVSGAEGKESAMIKDFMGLPSWTTTPYQVVNYASCHDNNTLIDRITLSRPDASREDIVKMNNLAAAFYMMSEGIPFMQAGEEMLRTKPNEDGSLNENSYNASDAVNSLKWSDLATDEVANVYEYYKGLIAFRKAHGALRLDNAADVNANVAALENMPANVVAFTVNGGVNGETSEGLCLIYNANPSAQEITLPDGSWDVYINGEKAGTEVLGTVYGTVTVDPISALVLVHNGDAPETPAAPSEPTTPETPETPETPSEPETPAEPAESTEGGSSAVIWIVVVVVAAAAVAGGVVIAKKNKNKK